MTLQQFVRSSLVAAGMLTVSGFALARQPPALQKAQNSASCAGEHARVGAGYRHAFARFDGRSAGAQLRTAAREGAGYREARTRFSPTAPAPSIACHEPHRAPMRSATLR
jgi:hypothetical protein